MTDPIADYLTRLRNAIMAHHRVVEVPASNLKKEITKILFEKGYILNYKFVEDGPQGSIKVALKYNPTTKQNAIKCLKRVSTPGLRKYTGYKDMPRVINGRNGMLFTKDGIMNMRNKKWENDYSPIEADGASYVDTMYSRAYLRHLFHAQELLAMQIASIHNLAFYLWLVGEARKHIIAGDFSTWKPAMVKRLSTRL